MKTCTKCGLEKEDEEFYLFKKRNYRNSYCKTCSNSISKQSRVNYKEINGVAYSTEWKRKDSEHRERSNVWDRRRNQEIKLQLIFGYGGKCMCCGESDPVFLTLEHKNHDGQEHRKSLGGSKHSGGMKIYKDVIKRGFPSEYTILCMNCNFAEKDGRLCPHKVSRSKESSTFRYFVPCLN